jgi:hypothetical protein
MMRYPSTNNATVQRTGSRSSKTTTPTRQWVTTALAISSFALPSVSQAVNFGPFFAHGFIKGEVSQGNNRCIDCQWLPTQGKDKNWADELNPGKPFGVRNTDVTLAGLWVGTKYDLGGGYKFNALMNNRWRDGNEELAGYYYEANVGVSHEEYGAVAYGAMTTRNWAWADLVGGNIGFSYPWGSSGAGYGVVKNALRITTRPLDVYEGDLVLEATYDPGNTDFKIHKPYFLELWAQYRKGDLLVDMTFQDTRNGKPLAFGQALFYEPVREAAWDNRIGGSGQSTLQILARYQVDTKLELSGGIRRNRWSGALATWTVTPIAPNFVVNGKDCLTYLAFANCPGTGGEWNDAFNVDWSTDNKTTGLPAGFFYRGYPVTSNDVMLGARYRMGQWLTKAGLMYLGKGRTSNPSERGQSNTLTVASLGLEYNFGNGFNMYGSLNAARYGRIGLSPISSPSNSAFVDVDSRIARGGVWALTGIEFVF